MHGAAYINNNSNDTIHILGMARGQTRRIYLFSQFIKINFSTVDKSWFDRGKKKIQLKVCEGRLR